MSKFFHLHYIGFTFAVVLLNYATTASAQCPPHFGPPAHFHPYPAPIPHGAVLYGHPHHLEVSHPAGIAKVTLSHQSEPCADAAGSTHSGPMKPKPAAASDQPNTESLPKKDLASSAEVAQKTKADQPVEHEVAKKELPIIQASEELEVDVRFAEDQQGSVFMRMGDFESELKVTEWTARRIRFITPGIGVLSQVPVELRIHRPDGFIVKQFEAVLVRSSDIRRVHRLASTSLDASASLPVAVTQPDVSSDSKPASVDLESN